MGSPLLPSNQVASSVPYDNSVSGLAFGDVQSVIDYLTAAAASGIQNYNIISSTAFASTANVDTFVTGITVTPASGTYAILLNASSTGTGSGQQMDCSIFKGGTLIADSKRSVVTPAGSHIVILSTLTVTSFNGSQACQMYVNPNGSSQTVNQRSMLLIKLGP